MNENEVKNNTNENNVVTTVEPVVSEKPVTVSDPEVTPINEPDMVTSEPEVTTPAVDVTPVVSTPTESVSVEEHRVDPQFNVSAVAENAVNGETVKKKSNTGIIVIVVVVLVAVLLLVVGFVLNNEKEEKPSTDDTKNNNSEVDKPTETPNDNVTVNGTLIEDVIISGYMCMGETCTISVRLKDAENTVDYKYSGPNVELIKSLSDYDAYVKVNIYVTGEGENITIVNYKLFNKSTNAKIDGVTTEAELRTVLGMYNVGTYTAELTLVEIGRLGFGFGDDEGNYTYRDYKFVDEKGFEYEMKYINPGTELDALVEGNKYIVTFEVIEGIFDYEYTIEEIK